MTFAPLHCEPASGCPPWCLCFASLACLGYGVDEVLFAVGKPFGYVEAMGSDDKSSEALGDRMMVDVRVKVAMV